jgi:hypothetical protein
VVIAFDPIAAAVAMSLIAIFAFVWATFRAACWRWGWKQVFIIWASIVGLEVVGFLVYYFALRH